MQWTVIKNCQYLWHRILVPWLLLPLLFSALPPAAQAQFSHCTGLTNAVIPSGGFVRYPWVPISETHDSHSWDACVIELRTTTCATHWYREISAHTASLAWSVQRVKIRRSRRFVHFVRDTLPLSC